MRRLILLFIAAAFLSSCSVKEDRADCPCWLRLDFSQCVDVMKFVSLNGWEDSLSVFETTAFPKDYVSTPMVVSVPKDTLSLAVWFGPNSAYVNDGVFSIPKGSDCDSLYVFSCTVDCSEDDAFVNVKMYKEFATVRLVVGGSEDGEFPFKMAVRGSVSGLDLKTRTPVEGEFYYKLSQAGKGKWVFRLPRQNDNSLMLDLSWDEFGNTSLPLGEWIAQTGYSWENENLGDIYVEVDYARSEAWIRVNDWEFGFDFKIEV